MSSLNLLLYKHEKTMFSSSYNELCSVDLCFLIISQPNSLLLSLSGIQIVLV